MILQLKDIKRILKERPNKAMIEAAQAYSKKCLMHMTGIGLDAYIELLEGYERPELLAIRKRYTRSNKDFFSRLHRPIDKVYNARGGSVYYNLPETQDKQFRAVLSNIEHGYSVRKWVETFYRPAYHYDPMGLIFQEVGHETTYPTYKSIHSIHEMQLSGRQPEYVFFCMDQKIELAKEKSGKTYTYYRLVDDAKDCIIQWDGEDARIVQKDNYKEFPNHFEKVPGKIISDIYDPQRGFYISPDDDIIELADQYLQEGSVLNIFKKYFGFPQRWQYQGVCTTCKGVGQNDGGKCKSCNGTGKDSAPNVSKIITLPWPESKDDPIVAPDIAGYITPATEGWDKMDNSLATLYNLSHYTYWGVQHAIQPTGDENNPNKTATQVNQDEQPKIERLNKFSEAAEHMEAFITDKTGEFYYTSFTGSDVNYGRRYLIESPDVIWLKYQDARTKGAPESALDNLLEEYLQTRYQNDSMELMKYLKLMRVEPFVHYTVSQAQTLVPDGDKLAYYKKLYYSEWLGTLQPHELIIKKAQELRDMLTAYVTAKNIKEPEQETAPIGFGQR